MNLFSRHTKENKLKFLDSMTTKEILSEYSLDTLTRILKERGAGKKGCRDRKLFLSERPGNDWNSSIEAISRDKSGKVYVWVYLQYGNTDTTLFIPAIEFFRVSGDYRGSHSWTDRYGDRKSVV